MGEASQVLEGIDEAAEQVGLRLAPQLGALLARALAEVVVLGGEAQMPVGEVGELALEPDGSAVVEA